MLFPRSTKKGAAWVVDLSLIANHCLAGTAANSGSKISPPSSTHATSWRLRKPLILTHRPGGNFL